MSDQISLPVRLPLAQDPKKNSPVSKKHNLGKRNAASEPKENKAPARVAQKSRLAGDEPLRKSRNLKFRPPGLSNVTNQTLSALNESTRQGKGSLPEASTVFQNICDVARLRGPSSRAAERPLSVAQDVLKVLSSKKGILSGGAGYGHELVTAQEPAPAIEGSLRQTCLMEYLPVDWSLKTFCRFSSDQSFDWCQGIQASEKCRGLHSFVTSGSLAGASQGSNRSFCTSSDSPDDPFSFDFSQSSQSQDPVNHGASLQEALYSWVHPESALPGPVLVSLAAASAKGSCPEQDFLDKRKRTWEDSLRSLYSMFRVKQCETFYVQAQSTLAMFSKARGEGDSTLRPCAQLSRSTRGLRAALCEQDVPFTMPLCGKGGEAVSMEEIQELREYERYNPGQTRHTDGMAAVDGTTDSLLHFSGALAVHGLLEFLINNRHMLGPAVGCDVPVLFSQSPYANACLRAPEVICRRIQRLAEAMGAVAEVVVEYTMELKGLLLMPWVVARLCRLLSKSQRGSFKASFATDPQSEAFNCSFTKEVHAMEGSCVSTNGSEGATSEGLLLAWQPSILDKAVMRSLSCQGEECALQLAMVRK